MSASSWGGWDIESFRLSIFHTGSSPGSLWEMVTEESPAAIDQRPRENISRTQGNLLGNTFLLSLQPQRVDWHFQPTIRPQNKLHTVSAASETLAILSKACDRTLVVVSPATRIAFGAVLIHSAASHETGVSYIARLLPQLPLDENTRDLLYRINRRRRFRGWQINRLATWSVEDRIDLNVVLPEGQVNSKQIDSLCKLQLDINSVPSQAIGREMATPLFEKMVSMASEIACQGDIA